MTVVTAAAIAPLAISSAAYAEGGFVSHLSGAKAGFNSRTWTDKNLDARSTTITLENCRIVGDSSSPVSVVVRLVRARLGPDEKIGVDKAFACRTADTKGWGRVPAGDYHFQIMSVNRSTNLAVSTSGDGVSVLY